MSVALSSNDSEVISKPASDDLDLDLELSDLDSCFEVSRCAEWIREKGVSKACLQLPDSLIKFGPTLAHKIEQKVGKKICLLVDTSFGCCCVDEVASDHVGCDGVIHFGNTCLTKTQRIPVLFVFTKAKLDVDQFVQCVKEASKERILVFYDVRFDHVFGSEEIRSVVGDKFRVCPPVEPDVENQLIKCGRLCPDDIKETDIILYCGNSVRYSLLLALTFSKNKHLNYIPGQGITKPYENINRLMMKRYYLIEKTKDAKRIGILVGTLGVTRYRDIIARVSSAIRSSGKKAYTFLVGKPNLPKLANFPEIDVFVMIACPENSVIVPGEDEFMQGIITPFELDVALNNDREWEGKLVNDFQQLLPGGNEYKAFKKGDDGDVDVSLISGQIRHTVLSTESDPTSTALSVQETSVSLLHDGGGGQFLNQRSWKGLEQKLGETNVEKAVQGRSGIAFGYQGEGK